MRRTISPRGHPLWIPAAGSLALRPCQIVIADTLASIKMAGTRRLSRYEFVDTVEKIGRRRRLNVPGALSAHVGRSQPIASSGSRWHWHRPGKWPRWLRVHARINTVRPCAAPVAFVISFLLQGGPTTILMSAPGFPRFRCYAGDDRFCGTDSSNFSASRATSGAAYCLETGGAPPSY